jgi:hypothetical protein
MGQDSNQTAEYLSATSVVVQPKRKTFAITNCNDAAGNDLFICVICFFACLSVHLAWYSSPLCTSTVHFSPLACSTVHISKSIHPPRAYLPLSFSTLQSSHPLFQRSFRRRGLSTIRIRARRGPIIRRASTARADLLPETLPAGALVAGPGRAGGVDDHGLWVEGCALCDGGGACGHDVEDAGGEVEVGGGG